MLEKSERVKKLQGSERTQRKLIIPEDTIRLDAGTDRLKQALDELK